MEFVVNGVTYTDYEQAQKAEAELKAWQNKYLSNMSIFCVSSDVDEAAKDIYFVVFAEGIEKRREMMSAFGRHIVGEQFRVCLGNMQYQKLYSSVEIPADTENDSEGKQFIEAHNILDEEPSYGISEVSDTLYVLNGLNPKDAPTCNWFETPGLRVLAFMYSR